jgi:hypothetical protein
MKLELLKSRVLNSFIESCADNLDYKICAARLIELLQEKNLILSNNQEKRDLGLAVLNEVPNLIVGLSKARTQLISTEGYYLNSTESFICDIQKHLPYLGPIKALSA